MYVKTAAQRKTLLTHENKEENDITPRRRSRFLNIKLRSCLFYNRRNIYIQKEKERYRSKYGVWARVCVGGPIS